MTQPTDWIQMRDTGCQIKAGIDNLHPGYQVQYEDILALVENGESPVTDPGLSRQAIDLQPGKASVW